MPSTMPTIESKYKIPQDEIELILNPMESKNLPINSLLTFIQLNFTGGRGELDLKSNFNPSDYLNLAIDGEEIYSLTRNPNLLHEAIEGLRKTSTEILISQPWWLARALFIHQRILDNNSDTLYSSILGNYKKIQDDYDLPSELKARLELEMGLVYHFYGQDSNAIVAFKEAQEITGLKWELSGVLGKRTKFQQKDFSQLAISASSVIPGTVSDTDTTTPVKHDLNDDTVLEKIEFTNPSDSLVSPLTGLDQTLLLAFCLNYKNTNPSDALVSEQMLPFLTRILATHTNFGITTVALIIKSRLESLKSRTVERSVLQLCTLVDESRENCVDPSRLHFFFQILWPSRWDLEKELGNRYISLGLIKSALEVYQRLEMYEEIISCYQMLEDSAKALQIIQDRLKVKPNDPKLLCLEGDVTNNPECYERAWTSSNHRFARAQRSLGSYYFTHNEFAKSIQHYQKAFEINPMFENSWFIMGCACLKVSEFDLAAKAFGRCTILDNNNSEAWNNLASVLITQKKLDKAQRCLQEAVKMNYEASNIWENLLFVSVDLKDYQQSIVALKRVFEIRNGKRDDQIDFEVLERVVDGVLASRNEGLVEKLGAVLDVINEGYNHHMTYCITSHFYRGIGDDDNAKEYMGKAYRALLNHSLLLENKDLFLDLVNVTKEYFQMEEERFQQKMLVKGVLGKGRGVYDDFKEYEELKELIGL